MTETLASLRASISRWVREGVSDEIVNDAISDAVADLYQGLLGVDSEHYLSQEPARFANDGSADGDPIPFQDEIACVPFLRYTALSLLGQAVYEDDSAIGWDRRAERARERVLQEALNKTDRPDKVDPFDPYRQTGLRPTRTP